MGSNSTPPKTLSDESINRGLVCAHMHFIARTQKILTFMSLTGEYRQQKHTQHAPSMKTECDYLNGWIKKRSHTQKSHPKMVNPRDKAGERKKKTTTKKKPQLKHLLLVCHGWFYDYHLMCSWCSIHQCSAPMTVEMVRGLVIVIVTQICTMKV